MQFYKNNYYNHQRLKQQNKSAWSNYRNSLWWDAGDKYLYPGNMTSSRLVSWRKPNTASLNEGSCLRRDRDMFTILSWVSYFTLVLTNAREQYKVDVQVS